MNGRFTAIVSLVSALLCLVALLGGCPAPQPQPPSSVRLWEEPLTIPTYEVGEPDPNPRFYAGRAYQGAQGRVYPHPMLDGLTDHLEDRTWKAVYLENEYVKVCVLPEIGGRVFSALDKTNDCDFIYRQHVIKPALIGMLGAWISGGIEWNFPHHHRASVFLPIDYVLRENPDGSKTLWMGELEIRDRMRWIIGLTLYPGRSYLEATLRFLNPTPFAHSFLYWANASVHARSGEYQVIFPPRTEYATYHAKNAFAQWPISHEVYRGVDYTRGVDLSWWKNHPSPMSFFAWNQEDDFLAGYDHGEGTGIVHVANHHVAPGKKFWEWGPGPRGRIWDEILTDADGPYVELMTGAWSDNQPDYSWLQPYEGKGVQEYWYPIRGMEGAKNANLEGAVNLEARPGDTALLAFNTTAGHTGAKVLLEAPDRVVLERTTDIGPDQPFSEEIALPSGVRVQDLRASLLSAAGEELIAYEPVGRTGAPMPDVVSSPPPPEEVRSVEELYLTGLRLEQFHNPALDARSYYEEALRRDPGNSRVNVAMGILYVKQGLFEKAEDALRTALARVTRDYTSPRDGEAYYYLGLTLRFQGKDAAAYDALYKATWSYAFRSAAGYQLATLDSARGEFPKTLEHLRNSLAVNAWNTKALDLQAAVLRRLRRYDEARGVAARALAIDPLDVWAAHELYLIACATGSETEAAEALKIVLAAREVGRQPWHEAQPYLEAAIEQGNCGLWDEAAGLLSLLMDPVGGEPSTYPMLTYWLGYFREKAGDEQEASRYYRLASEMPPQYCFPFRLESIDVLRSAARSNPEDARSHYYLGNLLFERQPEMAIREWEQARALGDDLATVHRNLGMAYGRVEGDAKKAIDSLERAVACDGNDPRLHYERDLLYEAGGVSPAKRLAQLRQNHETIVGHNDAFSREVVLLAQLGHYDEAIDYMRTHHFRRWEGVGNIHVTWVDAHLLRALEALKEGRTGEAIQDCEAALTYPGNLEVARPYHGGRSAQTYVIMGRSHAAAGEAEEARAAYEKSAKAKQAREWSPLRYYQGLALRQLGREDEARAVFDGLARFARGEMEARRAGAGIGFFSKFGTRRSPAALMADAHHMLGLALLGKGDVAGAKAEFERALDLNTNHLWAAADRAELE